MSIVRKSDNVIQVTILGGNGLPLTISSLADLEILAYQLPKAIVQRWLMSDGDVTDTDFADNLRREVDTDIELTTVEDSPTAYEA